MDSFGIDPLVGMATKIDTASSLSSRQKSCNACVRGKRRCDKRTPRCTRCAAKGLECVYHKMPPSAAQGGGGSNTSSTAAAAQRQQQQQQQTPDESPGGSTSPEMADLPDFDMGFDYESLGTETSPESMCHVPDQTPHYDNAPSHHNHNHNHNHNHHHQQQQPASIGNHQLHLDSGLDFGVADFMNTTALPTTTTQTTSSTFASPPPPTLSANSSNSFFASLFEGISVDQFGGLGVPSKLDIPPLSASSLVMSTALIPRPPVRDPSVLRRGMDCSGQHDPLAVHDPRSWMGYTVRALTGMHATFARTRALAFLHPRLWAARLPRPVQSVWTAATAYAHRSSDNRAWVMQVLADTAAEVHAEGEKAGAATSPQDKLALVQALLILDSIRIFDGDVGLRAAAEREAHVLAAWIGELQQVVVTLEAEAVQHARAVNVPAGGGGILPDGVPGATAGDPAYPARDRPPKTWDAWILLESARRTLLFACAFVCMGKLLKSLDVNRAMWQDLRFTASRHLWEAPSSVDFFRAWRDKPQYFIRDFDFKDFWSYARADDLDEFTKTMLMPQIGMDALEHFMAGEDLSHIPPAS
ncbi:C6 zinc finger domain protein [Cordyceps fumosorosea ARSEF 2679]|uniref:C6 zinc finger domain protein n=1 Tax=Cordyceps fumosorosea (strain ARSEF 2679) TaxID=1081104 RepID=A0A162J7K0_CORFA|nr:C6 zinc finger domain protein [Cordyceps fumosorosea ARSEF 2679]OAA64892.1 C6 zinc finger domain protein [Cordyceps fumosorosea ARSEF 2679]